MTGKDVIRIMKLHGWVLDRVSSSHHVMVKDGCRSIPVPVHDNRDIGILAKRILKQANIDE
jgi:predicted RNA binding protein YcfA (HicA-like mRNA interferase family)